MGRDALADRDTILGCLAAQEAINAQLAQCSFDALSPEELVEVLARREVLAWQAPAIDHRIVARFVAEGHSEVLAGCSLAKALSERLRISAAEARRRIAEAADLGPRTAMSGEPLDPVLPSLAAAQAAGQIGPEQMAIARKAMEKIPTTIDVKDRERAERDLAELATLFAPETFGRLAVHLIAVLDQDGDEPDDRRRHAQRGLRLGPQRADGLSSLSGKISPELRATLEPMLAKLAAPGMCNSADEQPCVSGTPSQDQIQHDHRTRDQRQHDALLAALRATLACGDLGRLNGLPVSVIVSTTLAELQAATGHTPRTESPITGKAHTAGGSLLPMGDLLRMASHAYHYLSIFDGKGPGLVAGPQQTPRLRRSAHRAACTRPRLHPPRMYGLGVSVPGPPPRKRLGHKRTDRCRRTRVGVRAGQPDGQRTGLVDQTRRHRPGRMDPATQARPRPTTHQPVPLHRGRPRLPPAASCRRRRRPSPRGRVETGRLTPAVAKSPSGYPSR
jgi:hypothetical protein|nr:DUF222 domain-containing protein [Mycolicibacter kumamotonensis]